MISPTNMNIRKASVHFESKHVLTLINVRAKRHEETMSDNEWKYVRGSCSCPKRLRLSACWAGGWRRMDLDYLPYATGWLMLERRPRLRYGSLQFHSSFRNDNVCMTSTTQDVRPLRINTSYFATSVVLYMWSPLTSITCASSSPLATAPNPFVWCHRTSALFGSENKFKVFTVLPKTGRRREVTVGKLHQCRNRNRPTPRRASHITRRMADTK